MAHKPFILLKRPSKKGYIYYVKFRDDYGNLMMHRSTGQSSRAAAENWAIANRERFIKTSGKDMSFEQYSENWWIWDQCPYVKNKIRNRGSLSRRYVDEMRGLLDRNILPYFKDYKLRQISIPVVEDWLNALSKKIGKSGKPLASSTILRSYACFRIMMRRAKRLKYISELPLDEELIPKERIEEKGIFTREEWEKLFNYEHIEKIWDGNLKYYLANKLALTTGMRQGEILAIMIKNVHIENTPKPFIYIEYSWSKNYGFVEPKWQQVRFARVDDMVDDLQKYISTSPYQQSEDLLFYGKSRDRPVHGKTISQALYRAISHIGIDENQRIERRLTFHSWRHTYNSFSRGKVSDAKLMLTTGHRRTKTVNGYTHWTVDDLDDVAEVQKQFFS